MSSSPYTRSPTTPAIRAEAITPADSALAYNARALYVGGTGDVIGIPVGQTAEVTFVGVPAGSILPVMFSQVSAATTATSIVALYE